MSESEILSTGSVLGHEDASHVPMADAVDTKVSTIPSSNCPPFRVLFRLVRLPSFDAGNGSRKMKILTVLTSHDRRSLLKANCMEERL